MARAITASGLDLVGKLLRWGALPGGLWRDPRHGRVLSEPLLVCLFHDRGVRLRGPGPMFINVLANGNRDHFHR